MKTNKIRLYNIIFPVWLLLIIPLTWIVVLPANFIIDLLVVFLTLKFIKAENIKFAIKKSIFKVWVFGFISDIIGVLPLFVIQFIPFDIETGFGKWWYEYILNPINMNPFSSLPAFVIVLLCVLLAGYFIYLFNRKVCLKKTELDDGQKHRLALSLAIFTAPYVLFLPTSWIY